MVLVVCEVVISLDMFYSMKMCLLSLRLRVSRFASFR